MCARSVITTTFFNVRMPGRNFSTNGTKVRSTKSTASSASFTIHAICSGKRRGLMVCRIIPDPETP